MSKFEIEIIHYLEQEGPVAEIYYDSIQWAEITKKKEVVTIEFYPHPSKEYWEFPCEEAINILEKTKTKLLMQSNKGNFSERMTPQDPKHVNELAEKVLKEILDHPEKVVKQYTNRRYGPVIEVEAPDLGGVRFTGDGKEMMGFMEPYWLKK